MSEPCPVCLSERTIDFFEVNAMPLFIGVQWDSAEEARACGRGDIRLVCCRQCGFIWNRSFAPDRLSYSPRYDNSLELSPAFQNFARSVATRLVNDYGIRHKHVLELGCGKGHFLKLLCEEGANRGAGFDPSCESEPADGVPTDVMFIPDFFGEQYRAHAGDLVCCRHVFEHIADPMPFLQMVRRVAIRPFGIIYFEVPNARFVFEGPSVWDIIYEHCNYFSSKSLAFVFQKCGFEVLRVDEPFDGQYLSIDARAQETAEGADGDATTTLGDGFDRLATFAANASAELDMWTTRLTEFDRKGKRVVVWGGGAKTVSFLNLIPAATAVQYVVDINPRKQGRYIAGSGQQIVSPEFLREFRPTTVILMNPIYHREVEDQLRELGISAEILDV